jgi:hypothetical protein
MFTPSREQARRLFFETWRKYRAGETLAGLEQTVAEVLLLHPEYHPLLDQPDRYLDRDYLPDSGQLNPFLHMSLHLAIAEQLAIDQPRGIRRLFSALSAREDAHDALHAVLECLGETVWEASRTGTPPDEASYLDCISRKAARQD